MVKQERLLIISNNVLSTTRNNGKTILSCIDTLPKNQVRQLYFSEEIPTLADYKYYQISDADIINARLKREKPGRAIERLNTGNSIKESIEKKRFSKKNIKRNSFTLFLRNAMWRNKWKSIDLFEWLDDFKPSVIFFVAGDGLFAYDICKYIKNKYHTRLCIYVTDDYIMPRTEDNIIDRLYRNRTKKILGEILETTDAFFTISEMMKKEYKTLFNKDSTIIVNMTDSLKIEGFEDRPNEYPIVFSYTGSLYYGRDAVLDKIGEALNNYNEKFREIKGVLNVYSNTSQSKVNISENSGCRLCGSLNSKELKISLNESDVLVFVESSKRKYIEKTKYSFSTKIPEYLSVGKIILAVGPEEISSMMYLKDCAFCVHETSELAQAIEIILSMKKLREEYGKKAIEKFNKMHREIAMQKRFLINVMQDGTTEI